MRKIETQMNAAIAAGKNWSSANTTVTFQVPDVAEVRLHGNLIAKIGEGWIQLKDGGCQSKTTKSRHNAILAENGLPGERVFAKQFDWFAQQGGAPTRLFYGMRLN